MDGWMERRIGFSGRSFDQKDAVPLAVRELGLHKKQVLLGQAARSESKLDWDVPGSPRHASCSLVRNGNQISYHKLQIFLQQ